jgi:hypothetical protein
MHQDALATVARLNPQLIDLAATVATIAPSMRAAAATVERLRESGFLDQVPALAATAQRMIADMPPIPSFLLED